MRNSIKIAIENLNAIIKKHDISQLEIEKKTGIKQGTISLYLRRKKTPSLPVLDKLAHAVGAETWQLLKPGADSEIDHPARGRIIARLRDLRPEYLDDAEEHIDILISGLLSQDRAGSPPNNDQSQKEGT